MIGFNSLRVTHNGCIAHVGGETFLSAHQTEGRKRLSSFEMVWPFLSWCSTIWCFLRSLHSATGTVISHATNLFNHLEEKHPKDPVGSLSLQPANTQPPTMCKQMSEKHNIIVNCESIKEDLCIIFGSRSVTNTGHNFSCWIWEVLIPEYVSTRKKNFFFSC